MHAVHQDHLHGVKILAEAGANVNSTADGEGTGVMCHPGMQLSLGLSHFLSLDGSTCLHQAAYSGNLEMIALLLSIGADGLKRVCSS